jgi:hypothetical protein
MIMGLFRTSPEDQGQNNFDSCQNRTVEYTDFVRPRMSATVEMTEDLDKDNRVYTGSSAELHCPKTADERVTVEVPYYNGQTRNLALAELKRAAGLQVCKTCVYAPMSPLEVSQYDAQIAKSDLEKVEMLKARAEAIAELAEVDPAYKHMP